MTPLETVNRTLSAAPQDQLSVSDVMARTSLPRDEVECALADLALAGLLRRLLVSEDGLLVARWAVQR